MIWLFESFVVVRLDEEGRGIVEIEFTKPHKGEAWRAAWESAGKLATTRNAPYLLVDLRKGAAPGRADAAWLAQTHYPRLEAAGLARMAVVLREEPPGADAEARALPALPARPTRIFVDSAAARRWLVEA